MWNEFNAHFQKKDRENVKLNHHDFLDPTFLTKLKDQNSRRTFFSNVGNQSINYQSQGVMNPYDDSKEYDIELGRHRLVETRKNYMKM